MFWQLAYSTHSTPTQWTFPKLYSAQSTYTMTGCPVTISNGTHGKSEANQASQDKSRGKSVPTKVSLTSQLDFSVVISLIVTSCAFFHPSF